MRKQFINKGQSISTETIAEQWVNLVLAHIESKKQENNKENRKTTTEFQHH